MQVVIVADLGGTLLRTGLVTPARVLVHQSTQRVGDRRGNAAIEALLRDALQEASRWAETLEPVGVGLAVPGLVDPVRGVIRYSVNLDLRELPIAAIAREVLRLPVVVENDVRAAAWGEWRWGVGRGTRHMAYLSAGTGIAAAVISDGRLYHGATAAAGEIGHFPVVHDGELCLCGQRGCLETVAGGWGIVRRARHLAARPDLTVSGQVEEAALTTEGVFEAAACNPAAGAIIREAGEFLGQAALAVVRLWNPECLVLAGGLFFDGSPLTDAVRQAVAGSGFYGEAPPPVHLAEFGSNSGLMGAACLVLAPN